MQKTQVLINLIKLETTLFSDHLPSSIAIACLYYIIDYSKVTIDLEIFNKIYNLSANTIKKIYMKIHEHVHEKLK